MKAIETIVENVEVGDKVQIYFGRESDTDNDAFLYGWYISQASFRAENYDLLKRNALDASINEADIVLSPFNPANRNSEKPSLA